MSNNSEVKINIGCGCFLYIIGAIFGFLLWPYTINTWLVFLGKPAMVVWWQGMILGIIPGIGTIGVISAFITWILFLTMIH